MTTLEFVDASGTPAMPLLCGAPCRVCLDKMTPCVIHSHLGFAVSTLAISTRIMAKRVIPGTLVWFDGGAGWRRVVSCRVEGMRVIWELSTGWAQRSVSETVTVLA